MKHLTIMLFIPLLMLAACGGSDDENTGAPDNPAPGAAIGISSTNGLLVAQVAYQSAASSGDIADRATSTGVTGSSTDPRAQSLVAGSSVIETLLLIPIPETQLPCAVSGTLTISGNLADPTTLTAGDTIAAQYDACDDGAGEVLDGRLDFEVDALEGDMLSGAYDLTMTMLLSDLQSTIGTDVLLANGDGTATINTLAAPYVEAFVTGGSMLTDANGSTELLTDYSSAQTVDTGVSPTPYTLLAAGTLDSSQLGGSVEYSVTVMFEGFDANYPHVGELVIVGDTSSARVTAQSNAIDVVIEIYSNTTATGTPDSVINTTWTELADL
jgi:hypothetical protein